MYGVGLLTDGFLGAARAALHVAEIGLGRVGFGAAGAALHVGEIGLLVATAGCQRRRIGIVGVLGVAHRGLLCRVCGRQRPPATVKQISRWESSRSGKAGVSKCRYR